MFYKFLVTKTSSNGQFTAVNCQVQNFLNSQGHRHWMTGGFNWIYA